MAELVAHGPGAYGLRGTVTFIDQPSERLWAVPLVAAQGQVTVDLSGLDRGDSVSLALLLEWERQARLAGHEFRVTQVPARLQDLMRVYGLGPFFGSA